MPAQDEYVWNQAGRSLSDLGKGLQAVGSGIHSLFVQPGLRDPEYGFNLQNKPIPSNQSIPGSLRRGHKGAQWTPSSAGRLNDAWPQRVTRTPGGNFGWSSQHGIRSSMPTYADVQGNLYDAVTGRLLEKPTYSGLRGFLDWHDYAQAQGIEPRSQAPTSRGQAPASRGQISTAATSPNTITQAADDDYKQLLSQYGGQTGLNQLAALTSLPTGFTPEGGKQAASLKDYYAAQQAVGGKNINDIITSMGYSGPMAEWAKANPMLAQREFAKRQAATPAPTLEGDLTGYGINANLGAGLPTSVGNLSAPSPYVPMSGFNLNSQIGSTGSQGYNAPPVTTGVFSPFKYGSENFGNPANPVVAPPAETQRVLNAPFNEAMVQAGRGLNPDNYTSQNFSVSKKADDFLSQPWLQGLGR